MVKDRKELIIYKALELYLINGYENVSITDLQSALDMGRGTMYYHFKNKDEIYVEIVNRFFLRPKQEMLRLKEDIRVPDMIEALLRYFKFLEESLMELEQRNINTSNVIMLLYSAYHRFPELYRRAHRAARPATGGDRGIVHADQGRLRRRTFRRADGLQHGAQAVPTAILAYPHA